LESADARKEALTKTTEFKCSENEPNAAVAVATTLSNYAKADTVKMDSYAKKFKALSKSIKKLDVTDAEAVKPQEAINKITGLQTAMKRREVKNFAAYLQLVRNIGAEKVVKEKKEKK
jgi:hypothetical protein